MKKKLSPLFLKDIYKELYNKNINLLNLLIEKDRILIIFLHEITNILQSLKSPLEKILKENSNMQEIELCYNRIHYLKTLQDNIFVYNTIKNGQLKISPAPINSILIIKEITNNYMVILNSKTIDIDFSYKKNLFLYADPYLTRLILNNIIEISINQTNNYLNILLDESKKEKIVYIEISHNGRKIDREIFENFYSEKPLSDFIHKKELGLYIIKELVKMNKGKINITSDKNTGTKFILKFPYYNSLFSSLYLFVMGILLSFPKDFGVIFIPGGACLLLYSFLSTILITFITVSLL